MSANVIGVDMGGTKILSAVIDAEGNILGTAKVPTKADRGPSVVIDRIADSIRKAIDKSGVAAASIQAVGIGAPGPLDPATGIVIFAPNLRWKNVRLKEELEARVNFPTFVDNDVNVGTLGEHVFGAGQGFQNVVGILWGLVLVAELFYRVNCSTVRVRQPVKSDILSSKRGGLAVAAAHGVAWRRWPVARRWQSNSGRLF